MSGLTMKQDKRHSIAVILAGILRANPRKFAENSLESDDFFYKSAALSAVRMYDVIDRRNRRAEAIFALGELVLIQANALSGDGISIRIELVTNHAVRASLGVTTVLVEALKADADASK